MFTKFTFRKEVYDNFGGEIHVIKAGRAEVGNVSCSKRNFKIEVLPWEVGFTVGNTPTEKNPAPFRWIFLKKRFKAVEEAREWLSQPEVCENILRKWDIWDTKNRKPLNSMWKSPEEGNVNEERTR